MWPATIGILVVAAVVFYFGLLSARQAARDNQRKSGFSAAEAGHQMAAEQSQARRTKRQDHDNDEDSHGAMAMAGPTKTNPML